MSRDRTKDFGPLGIILYDSTSLSKNEIRSIERVNGMIDFLRDTYIGDNYAYVGNVGIKSQIGSESRGRLNMSQDLDIIVFEEIDDNDLKRMLQSYDEPTKVERAHLLEAEKVTYPFAGMKISTKFSPFEVVHVELDKVVIDFFTYSTGIGPIPIYDEDKECVVKRYGLPVMDTGYLLATNLNPKAITKERMNRVAHLLNNRKRYSPKHIATVVRKLTEAIEQGTIEQEELEKTLNMLEHSNRRKQFREVGVTRAVENLLRSDI